GMARGRGGGDDIGLGVEADRTVGRPADASDCQWIAVGIGVVGKQRRCRNLQRRVLYCREAAVIGGYRRLVGWRLRDIERDRGRGRAAAAIGDRIGEAGSASVIVRRREGDGIGLGVEADGAVGRAADAGDRQWIAVGIGVVAKQRRCRNLQRRVLYCRKGTIVLGHRRLIRRRGCRMKHYVHPVIGVLERTVGEDIAAAVSIDAVVAGWRSQRPVGLGG